MHNIISHEGNTSQDHNETLLHTQMARTKKTGNRIMVRMWENWNPHTLQVGIHNGTITLENRLAIPQKVNCSYYMTPQFYT